MRKLAATLVLAATAACAPADPAVQLAQQWSLCESGMALVQDRILACSAVVAASADDPARRAQALLQRGILRGDIEHDTRAIADFGRALRIDPTLVDVYIERAQLHYARSAYDAAVRDYEAALRLQPNHPMALQGRDAALRGEVDALGNQLDAIAQALARQPSEPSLWNQRCWIRAVEGQELDYALADCNEALRLDPRHAAALDSRGLVHLKRGDNEAALADYEAALAVEPGRGHYLYGRGVARVRLGQTAAGQADLVAAERAEPGVTRLYQGYEITL